MEPRPFSQVRLGPLEQQVMEHLWADGERTIRELITALGDHYAYTTLATVLTNLERKETVTAQRVGRSVHYSARLPRSEHVTQLMLQALFGSTDRDASIRLFVESLEAHEIALLRRHREDVAAAP